MPWVDTDDLAIEDSGPRHLTIVDVDGVDGAELVFHTPHGGLIVMNAALDVTHRLNEPGIVDFVVEAERSPPVAGHTRPIWVQSERGHVVKVVLAQRPAPEPGGLLLGASKPLNGTPAGLVRGSNGRVVALQVHTFDQYPGAVIPGGSPPQPIDVFGYRLHEFSLDLGPGGGNMLETRDRFVEVTAPEFLGFGLGRDVAAAGDDFLVLYEDRLQHLVMGGVGGVPGVALPELPGAVYALDIAVGEIDGLLAGEEVVIATEGGQLVYFRVADVQAGTLPARTGSPIEWTNGATSATWGLVDDAAGGGPSANVYALDQASRLWHVDPDNGAVTWLMDMTVESPGASWLPLRKPLRGLGWIPEMAGVPGGIRGMVPRDENGQDPAWRSTLDPLAPFLRTFRAYPFALTIALQFALPPDWGPRTWVEASLDTLFARPNRGGNPIAGELVVFPVEGDVLSIGNERHIQWWSSQKGSYELFGVEHSLTHRNIVHGARTESSAHEFYAWATMRFDSNVHENSEGLHLRNVSSVDGHDHVCLRAARWSFDPPGVSCVVASTTGGSVQILQPEPSNGPFAERLAESDDYGFGGMALEVTARDMPGSEPLIFHATLWTHAPAPATGSVDLTASLQILERTGPTALLERARKIFDGDTVHPKLFAIAAIAVGDVDGATTGGDPEAEMVLGTLNGDLVVLDLDFSAGNVPALGATLFWEIFDGSVGGCDAIRIADLSAMDPGNELYVATSRCIRKFVQKVQP